MKRDLARLDRYKEITAKLADPRKISETEAHAHLVESLLLGLRSDSLAEDGSPEMSDGAGVSSPSKTRPFIEDIRKNMIVMITPALEVDGRDRMVDLYNYPQANPGKAVPPLLYWGRTWPTTTTATDSVWRSH